MYQSTEQKYGRHDHDDDLLLGDGHRACRRSGSVSTFMSIGSSVLLFGP